MSIVAHPIYDRNNQLVTQGAFNALLSQLDFKNQQIAQLKEARLVQDGKEVVEKIFLDNEWNAALESAATWIERSVTFDTNGRLTEFAHNMAMSIRAQKRKRKEVVEVAQPCGGYYCSEEHGHIDCAPEKAI